MLVPTCEVSRVQTNVCIVAARAIPAASAPSFPSVISIIEGVDSESLGLLALLYILLVGVYRLVAVLLLSFWFLPHSTEKNYRTTVLGTYTTRQYIQLVTYDSGTIRFILAQH